VELYLVRLGLATFWAPIAEGIVGRSFGIQLLLGVGVHSVAHRLISVEVGSSGGSSRDAFVHSLVSGVVCDLRDFGSVSAEDAEKLIDAAVSFRDTVFVINAYLARTFGFDSLCFRDFQSVTGVTPPFFVFLGDRP
jgi:hypothetical protein